MARFLARCPKTCRPLKPKKYKEPQAKRAPAGEVQSGLHVPLATTSTNDEQPAVVQESSIINPRVPVPPPTQPALHHIITGQRTLENSISGSLIYVKWEQIEDEAVWRSFMEHSKAANVRAALLSHPASTFNGKFRKAEGKERYGLSHLSMQNKELVRTETLAAVRMAEIMVTFAEAGIHCVLEHPKAPAKHGLSILKLDEFKRIQDWSGLRTLHIDQCRFGLQVPLPLE